MKNNISPVNYVGYLIFVFNALLSLWNDHFGETIAWAVTIMMMHYAIGLENALDVAIKKDKNEE